MIVFSRFFGVKYREEVFSTVLRYFFSESRLKIFKNIVTALPEAALRYFKCMQKGVIT